MNQHPWYFGHGISWSREMPTLDSSITNLLKSFKPAISSLPTKVLCIVAKILHNYGLMDMKPSYLPLTDNEHIKALDIILCPSQSLQFFIIMQSLESLNIFMAFWTMTSWPPSSHTDDLHWLFFHSQLVTLLINIKKSHDVFDPSKQCSPCLCWIGFVHPDCWAATDISHPQHH